MILLHCQFSLKCWSCEYSSLVPCSYLIHWGIFYFLLFWRLFLHLLLLKSLNLQVHDLFWQHVLFWCQSCTHTAPAGLIGLSLNDVHKGCLILGLNVWRGIWGLRPSCCPHITPLRLQLVLSDSKFFHLCSKQPSGRSVPSSPPLQAVSWPLSHL